MFGVVPKTIWNRINPADDNNLCTWSLRCLLIEMDDKKILIDTGMGNKQDEKFRSHFHPHGPYTLESSLKDKGVSPEEITDVFLTHLHFDHVGGAVKKNADGNLVPTFPNATYWSNKQHYNWAYHPNERERASFLKENFVPLMDHSVLEFIDIENGEEWLPGFRIHTAIGHTDKMMVPELNYRGRSLYYCADLLASSGHIRLPYVMSYDVRPLETLKEKDFLLKRAFEQDAILYFEHDHTVECCTLTKDSRGRITMDKILKLEDIV